MNWLRTLETNVFSAMRGQRVRKTANHSHDAQHTFPQEARLRRSSDFERVYSLRQRISDHHLLIFGAANDTGLTRIGLSVSRKHGNAVRRNQIKRWLREAFRLTRQDLPQGLDLILIPRPMSDATLEDYQQSLTRLVHKLAKRLHTHHE